MITFPGGVERKMAQVVLVHLRPALEPDRQLGEIKCERVAATGLQ